jgi:ankyrin repeat protein
MEPSLGAFQSEGMVLMLLDCRLPLVPIVSHKLKILSLLLVLPVSMLTSEAANPWFDAIKAGDVAAVTRLANAGADLEARNEWEGTALAEAIWSGKQEVIPILLARGANPNTSGQYGTPLCLAIDKWDTIAIRMLLDDPRTDATLARRDGATPFNLLRFTENKFNAALAEALLKRGAAINGLNSEGQTPLMRSCWAGSEKWVSLLVKAGADLHFKNADGETAYVKAAQRGWFGIMKILEDRGAKVPVLLQRSIQAASPLTPAQQWALATGAILNQRLGLSHEALIPPSISIDERAAAIRLLKEQWDIGDRDQLAKVQLTLESSVDDPQYAAWSLCGCANVAQLGAIAGYTTEAAAWERMLSVGRRIQEYYRSWSEMADSYLNGRRRWYRTVRTAYTREAQKAQPEIEHIVQLLSDSKDPNSPWTKNKWNTKLEAAAAAVGKPAVLNAPGAIFENAVPITTEEWISTPAKFAIRIPQDKGWSRLKISADSMNLTLGNKDGLVFHITCFKCTEAELTDDMVKSAMNPINESVPEVRSEFVTESPAMFREFRAHRWIRKYTNPSGPIYFSEQLLFVRKGYRYTIMANTHDESPFRNPAIDELVSRIRFLD